MTTTAPQAPSNALNTPVTPKYPFPRQTPRSIVSLAALAVLLVLSAGIALGTQWQAHTAAPKDQIVPCSTLSSAQMQQARRLPCEIPANASYPESLLYPNGDRFELSN